MTRELQSFVPHVPSYTAPNQGALTVGRAASLCSTNLLPMMSHMRYSPWIWKVRPIATSMIGVLAYWDATPVSMVMIVFWYGLSKRPRSCHGSWNVSTVVWSLNGVIDEPNDVKRKCHWRPSAAKLSLANVRPSFLNSGILPLSCRNSHRQKLKRLCILANRHN